MRILFTNDAPLIKYGLAKGFAKNGCQNKIISLCQIKKKEQEKKLKNIIEEFKPDFIFTEGHAVGIHQPSFFKCLKEMNIPLFYWAIEDPVHLNWISLPYAQHSTIVFTTAIECVEKYEKKGIKADTLLFACNPEFHKKTAIHHEYKHDLAFVGSNYDIRYDAARQLIIPLIEKDYDIKVWGLWWQDKKRPVTIADKYYGGLLAYEELAKVYSSTKIVLGLHCDASSLTQSSMRTYEVMGCGAFYLSQYTKAHEHLFNYGQHLVWSKSKEETLKLVDYYLQHEKERKKIGLQGQEYVYKHHTYTQRAEKVLNIAETLL